jgi:carboxylate-amine ligase
MTGRTVGVEEELLLVDEASGQAQAVAGAVLQAEPSPAAAETLDHELQLEQLETGTEPCRTLAGLAGELRRCRLIAAQAAERAGARIAALGTSPLTAEPSLTGRGRYRRMAAEFGLTAEEQLACGCHVHVGVESDDEGAAVLDRIQPWLPVLLALTANSPFWQGRDSGYASFRYQAWGRWPSSGPTAPFGDGNGYHRAVQAMLDTGTVLDQGMVYFDARLSAHYPTVELRVADVCLEAADAVLTAVLARGLVETAAREWRVGRPADPLRLETLRLAAWRASRSGLDGDLIDPGTGRPAAAATVARRLIEHTGPALDEAGDLATVQELLDGLLARGPGARFQRQAAARDGGLAGVVRAAAGVTTGSLSRLPG